MVSQGTCTAQSAPPSRPIDLPPGALRLSTNSVALPDEQGNYSLLSAPEDSLLIYNASGWWIKTQGKLTLLQASQPRPRLSGTAAPSESHGLRIAAALIEEQPNPRLQIVLIAAKDVTITAVSYGERQWLKNPLTLRAGSRFEISNIGPSSGEVWIQWLEDEKLYRQSARY